MSSIPSYQSFLDKMKNIQKFLLEYIEKIDNIEEHYQNLIKSFNDSINCESKHELDSVLNLLINIANNHFRSSNFFSKIEKILLYFKNEIKQSYSNNELFNIFKSNKRILLFLLDENMITMNESIVSVLNNGVFKVSKYPNYFLPEIQKFLDHESYQKIKKDFPDDYEEKRKNGENETYICELIRNDSIDDFISYFKKNNLLVDEKINQSIFETNSFLIKRYLKSYKRLKFASPLDTLTLIEYSAFFGSTQIFNFLYKNGAKIEQSIWLFAVHSQNPELIHVLIDNNFERKHSISDKCYLESIKCHYNDIGNYILTNFLDNKPVKSFNVFGKCIKFYNYALFDEFVINNNAFFNFCKYDHSNIVEILLRDKNIDVNAITQILCIIFHKISSTICLITF